MGPPKPKRKFRTRKLDLLAELAQKFPHLANEIFDSLDDQSLGNCHAVNRSWANFIQNNYISYYTNYLQSQPRFRFKLDLMAELAQRFPRLAKEIFDSIDDQSLANCHAVNRPWANYLRSQLRFRFKIERLVRRTDRSCGTICQDFIIILFLQCWGMRACDGDYTI